MIGVLKRKENNEEANQYYIRGIEEFGGRVVLINDSDSFDVILEKLKNVKGILLTGGDDVGRVDYYLISYALENNLRLLGICQGMQSMALYGSSDKLIAIGNLSHKKEEGYVHEVNLSNDSILKELLGTSRIMVNSHHLQTVHDSYKFRITGYSDDGLIEVVEGNRNIFQVGVQWHPERMLKYDINSRKILEKFVK